MRTIIALAVALVAEAASPAAGDVRVVAAAAPAARATLPLHVGGRAAIVGAPEGTVYRRQWPGSYFETAFRGREVYFQVGAGEVSLHVRVDGRTAATLVKPAPGFYKVDGLGAGDHRLRVDVMSESQAGPTSFGGFHAAGGVTPRPLPRRARQIEFVGDSHTVGYGNSATTRTCSDTVVWATTDTSRGVAPLTAGRYDADYHVNAISGRGVVRNYNGFAADTLPEAYPYVLFDKAARYADSGWRPRVIAISLGTNDFTTPLRPGERWTTRDALHADFEAAYIRFVRDLRRGNPEAFFILWATDMAAGEIKAEVGRVVARLQAAGETRIAFVPVDGLTLSACNAHPSLADDRVIADAIGMVIDAHPGIWPAR